VQQGFNKKKIINDPVYGFVSIPSELIYDLIEHRYFQRLRRIRQLGLSNMVYPGAQHTRFQHVIGSMSLTVQAVDILRSKGIAITAEECDAVCAAVLLHDMGHGPFSHTLEEVIIKGVHHEDISLAFMQRLNDEMQGRLGMAIDIFRNTYHKKFLHQLVSSQVDMDRLDYLRRDSFYTGVQEGVIGHDRIIHMMNVVDDEIVIEEKGIYAIEKFLIARRLMYWQVYLHKTVIAAEELLVRIFQRAKFLAGNGIELFASPAFSNFLYHTPGKADFFSNPQHLDLYSELDDSDIFGALKVWCSHDDKVLAALCKQLRDRNLPKITIQHTPYGADVVDQLKISVAQRMNISVADAAYFVFSDRVMNTAYSPEGFNIKILYRNGQVLDIAEASDQYNISALAKPVTKYFLCCPKNN
jgi:HD superfamily phosphohydrolase